MEKEQHEHSVKYLFLSLMVFKRHESETMSIKYVLPFKIHSEEEIY